MLKEQWKHLCIPLLIIFSLAPILTGCASGSKESESSNAEVGNIIVDRNLSKIPDPNQKYFRGTFFSDALGITRGYNIYLPEGYDENEDVNYPVLYLLRAAENELPGYGVSAYEKLVNENKIGPMILVFPNTGRGIAVNYLEAHPGLGKSQLEDYFIEDLIGHIDSKYRTIDSKYGRAIDGFSLGGFSSLFLALKYPDKFSSVGSFDGTITPPDYSGFMAQYDRSAFGFPMDGDYYSKNNPSNLMRDGEFHELNTLTYYIQASGSNLSMNKNFLGLMEEKGLSNSLESYILPKSQHTYSDMARHLEMTMPLHYKGFKLE